ncbi:Rv3654c family TadE-like protein [Streptomyces sp. NPDC088785]|uniref:Rv3654c family TadE-like protein n=1 Tax=Streptomyces sp. NPDC088785 TaxID=3365897 RepID=UPI003807A888
MRSRGEGRWRRIRLRGDRGAATVWTVMAMAVVGAVFGGVLVLGQAVQIRHRAGGAADLAALAAAERWTQGGERACAAAARVARAQGASVVRCAVRGEVAEVTAGVGSGVLAAEVRARAGPGGPAPTAPGTEPRPDLPTRSGPPTSPDPSPPTHPDPDPPAPTGPGPDPPTPAPTGPDPHTGPDPPTGPEPDR